jgi:OOP family OmpA-OmpF porin
MKTKNLLLPRAVMLAVAVSLLSACGNTTRIEDYNLCALGWGAAGLGAGLASSGLGVVVGTTAVGAGIGYWACDEDAKPVLEPQAPAVAAVATPIVDGDADVDGVRDSIDKCPATARGERVDTKGCPEPLVFASDALEFAFGSAVLPADADVVLKQAVKYVSRNPQSRVLIVGHTDWVGKQSANQPLSEERAQAVKAYLIGRGVDPRRLVAEGRGELEPVADNRSEAGRAQNRRVVLSLIEE